MRAYKATFALIALRCARFGAAMRAHEPAPSIGAGRSWLPSFDLKASDRRLRPCGARSGVSWRKEMGVEPTRQRVAPPTGFEARPTHQDRCPSLLPLQAVS